MEPVLPSFLVNLWPVIWPIVVIAVLWIVIRFVFRLAMRVMLTGCAVLLVAAVALFILRVLR